MPKKRHKPEEIVAKLRQVDVLMSQGQPVADAIRVDRRDGGHVLSLAPGVRRPEERSGEAAEGSGDGERAASPRRLGPDAGQADPEGGCLGKLLLYSGFIGQLPCVRILDRRVNGPAELLLLSEVGLCRLMMGSEGVGGAI